MKQRQLEVEEFIIEEGYNIMFSGEGIQHNKVIHGNVWVIWKNFKRKYRNLNKFQKKNIKRM